MIGLPNPCHARQEFQVFFTNPANHRHHRRRHHHRRHLRCHRSHNRRHLRRRHLVETRLDLLRRRLPALPKPDHLSRI